MELGVELGVGVGVRYGIRVGIVFEMGLWMRIRCGFRGRFWICCE